MQTQFDSHSSGSHLHVHLMLFVVKAIKCASSRYLGWNENKRANRAFHARVVNSLVKGEGERWSGTKCKCRILIRKHG